MVVATLFLLCVLVPQYAAAPNLQDDPDAVDLNKDMGKSSLWGQPSRYASDFTLSKYEGVAMGVTQLPPWEKIVAYADKLLEVTNEGLNTAAREFHIQEKIDDFRNTFGDIVFASTEIREHMTELTQKGLTLDQISDELGVIFNDILDHLRKSFPPPDQAPSHEERLERVISILDEAERRLLDFARKHGMSEDGVENLRGSFDRLKPHIQKLVVITGDLIEQHPIIFSTLVFAGVAMLIPESWFLRPLLRLVGFGPEGPIKGSLAAWAQRWFFGAQVPKAGWFAILQSAGMKGISYARPIMGAIGGAIGAITPCLLSRSFRLGLAFRG